MKLSIPLPDHPVALFKRAATEQGGLLSGKDPSAFNPDDPIRLWIIQVGIIICTANLLALGLGKIKQPKVIAEVLGGIILGPTAFGRIPGFTEHIFPQASRSYLSLVANIGLCLFLFLVGLEIDAGVIKRNARLSATVSVAGMVIPFGLGVGLAVPIYNQFIEESVKFTHFMLFAGVAFSITAFPVLCRILTELKLLDTTVGIVVLSAGVGNDIVGWVLLALSVALVNAGTGLTALYILLVCVGWSIFILMPVRWGMKWLARKTGSIERGPSVLFMTVTILVLFGSAFFTDIIGVHAIFGAFLAGLIVPREGGLAIALTEKLEDMVAILFLPLYFTLSGLSTDLGLLDNGITWGYTFAIMALAFIGKFGGCLFAAHYGAGFTWRESSTIGSLMSCKGLVELIVLNVGLNAKILDQRVFSMFVLEALVLTFMTTPLVVWLYPPQARVRVAATGANFNNVAGDSEQGGPDQRRRLADGEFKTRFTVVLDKFEHLAGMMALTQLVSPSVPARTELKRRPSKKSTKSSAEPPHQTVHVEALRVIELGDRVSAVMKSMSSSAAETVLHTDPMLSTFRMFGFLNEIFVTPSLSIVTPDELAYSISEHARNHGSDMIMVPWLPFTSHSHNNSDNPRSPTEVTSPNQPTLPTSNPFESLFKSGTHTQEINDSVTHSRFVRDTFSQATTDVALFVDRGTLPEPAEGSSIALQHHVFLPFFGGPDDRLALDFVMQLVDCNPNMHATVVRITKRELETVTPAEPQDEKDAARPLEDINALTIQSRVAGYPDTYYGQFTTQTRLQSDTADNISWEKYARGVALDGGAPTSAPAEEAAINVVSRPHPRVEFKEVQSHSPLQIALQEAQACTLDSGVDVGRDGEDEKAGGHVSNERSRGGRRLLTVITGRSRRLAVENHRSELSTLMKDFGEVGVEVRRTLGDVASAFVALNLGSGIVVLQATVDTNVE